MNARARWLLLAFCCALVACVDDDAPIDAAIFVDASEHDASTLDGGASDAAARDGAASDAAEDGGATGRLDVALCPSFDVVPREVEARACAASSTPDGDCAAPHDGPAFAIVGRDLCAEALAASGGRARVQFAPAVDVREVSCDGLLLAPRASGDGVRIDFHGHAAVADALANDAPFSVEAEAVIGASGCVASLVVRAPRHTIVLGELPATGGQLRVGTSTPVATIDVAPTFAAGSSCLGESAVCVTPSYGEAGETTIVASLCSGSTWTYACGDYADYLALGTTACGARLRLAHVVQSYVRICH